MTISFLFQIFAKIRCKVAKKCSNIAKNRYIVDSFNILNKNK